MAEDEPKSSYELAMERLRKQDRDQGVEARTVSPEQKAALAELRRVYEAKLAEREILHRSALRQAGGDPEALETLEERYRRDREQIASERDRKIEGLRQGGR